MTVTVPVDLSDVPADLREPVAAALAAVGVDDGHLAVEIVDAARIRELNAAHRGKDEPTDVLSFPIDELGPAPGPPPPCGWLKDLCRFRWTMSKPMSPGRVRPMIAFRFAPS